VKQVFTIFHEVAEFVRNRHSQSKHFYLQGVQNDFVLESQMYVVKILKLLNRVKIIHFNQHRQTECCFYNIRPNVARLNVARPNVAWLG
jgi:hypothetical protein